MVLVISSMSLNPDTLNYHGQSIEMVLKNLNCTWYCTFKIGIRISSLWFSSEAILHPDIFDLHPSFFLGGTVLWLVFLYLLSANRFFIKKEYTRQGNQIGWILY